MKFDEMLNITPEMANAIYEVYVHKLSNLDTSLLNHFDDTFSEFVLYTDHTDPKFVEEDAYYYIDEFGAALSYCYYPRDGYDFVTVRYTLYITLGSTTYNHPIYDIQYLVKDGKVINDMIYGIYRAYFIEDIRFYNTEQYFIAFLEYDGDDVSYNFYEYEGEGVPFTKLDETALESSCGGNIYITLWEKPAEGYYCLYEDNTINYEFITAGQATALDINAIEYYYIKVESDIIDMNIINNAPTLEEILLVAQAYSGPQRDFVLEGYDIECDFNGDEFSLIEIAYFKMIDEDEDYYEMYYIDIYPYETYIYGFIKNSEIENWFDYYNDEVYLSLEDSLYDDLPEDKVFTQEMLDKYSDFDRYICGISR